MMHSRRRSLRLHCLTGCFIMRRSFPLRAPVTAGKIAGKPRLPRKEGVKSQLAQGRSALGGTEPG